MYHSGHRGQAGNLQLYLTFSIDPPATKLYYTGKNPKGMGEHWLQICKNRKIDMEYKNYTYTSILTYSNESKIMNSFFSINYEKNIFAKKELLKQVSVC